jgi:ubiquinone/menaquinone biosynthesis C-methylase UbiE
MKTFEETSDYYEVHSDEYFRLTSKIRLAQLWNILYKHVPLGSSILDLGCGSGRDVAHFIHKKYKALGIDYSYNLLTLAKHKFDIPVIQAKITELPFREHSYDAAWAIASLLHFSKKDIGEALTEIRRVLRQKAILISSIKEGKGENSDSLGRYFSYYSSEEWKSILSSFGYQVIECGTTVEKREPDESHDGPYITWITCVAKIDK